MLVRKNLIICIINTHLRAAKQTPLKSQTLKVARESKWRLAHSQWGKPVADLYPSFIQRTKEGSNLKRQV